MAKNSSPKMIEPEPETENEQMSESYISIGLGILVVVVVGILLYNFFTQKNADQNTAKENGVTDEATTSAQNANSYTVKEGDTLWSIAETVHKSGYNWNDLAKANNLSGNEDLKVGQVLVVPSPVSIPSTDTKVEVAVTSPSAASDPVATPVNQASESSTATQKSITGSSYTVVKGDTLWDIACRSYGDCYAWIKIYQTNKLADPNLIYEGNILSLPR